MEKNLGTLMNLEQDIRDNLNFSYCGGDLIEYRHSCADRYDAINKLIKENLEIAKKSEYINKVNKIIINCQKDDVESIISKFLEKYDPFNKEELEIKIEERLMKVTDDDLCLYDKILEFALQRRLHVTKKEDLILDSVISSNKKSGTFASVIFMTNQKRD